MKNLLACLSFGLVLIFSVGCNDENDPQITQNQDCDYFKAQLGTTWSFDLSDGTTLIWEVVGDTTIGGNLLHKVKASNDPTQDNYMGCIPDGINVSVPNPEIQGATIVGGDLIMNFPVTTDVGETWQGPIIITENQGLQATNDYRLTMVEKDLTLTLNGTTYNDVVKIQMNLYTTLAGQTFEFAREDFYIAPDVGISKFDVYIQDFFSGNWEIAVTGELSEYNY